MDIRNCFVLFLMLCFLGGIVSAQNSETVPSDGVVPDGIVPSYSAAVEGEPSFRLSDSDTGLLFFQTLTWEKAQYAVSYHVILERKRDTLDVYTEVLRRNITENSLDISVPFGEYRFRVLSFNILGLLDSESEWEYFIVIQALQPSVVEFSPSAFYFDRLTPRIITLSGENILLDAEIYLESLTSFDETGEPIIIRPVEIHRNELGENARLIFDEEELILGMYAIVIKNPGGLETRAGVFKMSVAKPFDINVSVGYVPMITLFGQEDYFLSNVFNPLGFAIRGNFVPFKRDIGFFGIEMTASWSLLTSETGIFKSTAHLLLINLDALYQYQIVRKTLFLNARAGIGLAGIFDYKIEYTDTGHTSSSFATAAFSFNFGASVQWFIHKQIFVEGGVDYIHIAHPELPMGFVRIGLFGGYQF